MNMYEDVCDVCGDPTDPVSLTVVGNNGPLACAKCAEEMHGHDKEEEEAALHDYMADMKRDMRREMGEGLDFDKYMDETLRLEDRRARQLAAPTIPESLGKVRQKRVQELPQNRIRIGGK